ncbi:hypothetical protein KDW_19070 [Dictyobacter vulcani]|uniref:Peptidase C51 domain-containing protein n=1 Tax=Dictyobacter vulcani TaxID=2607529 RepID=A0A5J4KIW4_9CHLR|nr:CHAP domain-containing protein [Dictyobacter vulcani]GER87745.1 hypothetical protein KDW_19070 [Dictyobacter vulcani]
MPKTNSISQFVSQHRVVRTVAGQVVIIAALALMLLGGIVGTTAQTEAKSHVNTATQATAKANVNTVSNVQTAPMAMQTQALAIRGAGNFFPWGQCTYWANMRYHQLHGIYVPWTIYSNAYQWTARAYQFGWKVSTTPRVGAIMQISPWTQGAGAVGHVTVVERILGPGLVLVSQMNWGGLGVVSYSQFRVGPGTGTYFISYN